MSGEVYRRRYSFRNVDISCGVDIFRQRVGLAFEGVVTALAVCSGGQRTEDALKHLVRCHFLRAGCVGKILVAHGALPVFNVAVAVFVVYAVMGNFINETVSDCQFVCSVFIRIILAVASQITVLRQTVFGAGRSPCGYRGICKLGINLQLIENALRSTSNIVYFKAEILIGIVSCIGAVNVKRLARAERRGGRMNGCPSVALVQFCLERPLHGFPPSCVHTFAGQNIAFGNDRRIGMELHKGRVFRTTVEIACGSIGIYRVFSYLPVIRHITVHEVRVTGCACRSGETRVQRIVRAAHVDG